MPFTLPKPEILAKPVQPDAAIAFWQARAAMTPEQAKALPEQERWRAFYVAGLSRLDQVQLVKDAFEKSLRTGGTFETFKKDIAGVIQDAGWHDHRIATIFRTNMQMAYAAGHYAKAQAVKAQRPYWQYITVEDRKRRPSHAVLHGLVYHADHEFWNTNHPPNGFACRCGKRTLSERQMKREGLTAQTEMPRDMLYTDPVTGMEYHVAMPGADKGFANNPGKDWMESMLRVTTDKLEMASPELSAVTVRTLARGGLELWSKAPKGNFPLAVLAKADAAAIGAAVTVAHISPETWKKQVDHHPELTLADYWLAQDAVESGEKYQQTDKKIAFVLNRPGGMVVIVKATIVGKELFITSVYKISENEAKREKALRNLGKK